jgi:two-component system sensor histidine kinase KdpD
MRTLLDYLSLSPAPRWPALLIWSAIWLILLAADPWLDLANLSLILLTGSAAASLWLPPLASIIASTASVIAFNWLFVPPRGSFHVDLPQHLMLLLTMIIVNGLIALLMELQRRAAIRSNDQRLRNTLLMSVSHDFRTPLSVIIGTAATLQARCNDLADPEAQRLTSVIHQQSSRLSHIVDNVLQLVRLDTDAVRLKEDWETPEELIGTAVQLSRQRAAGRSIVATVPPGLPLLWCDGVLIVQLLENLIDNALKYSPEREPVTVSAIRAGSSVCFSVEDHGAGVSMAVADSIAESYRHGGMAMAAMTTEGPGTGIGLTLCQAIARLHDARLEATPCVGGGTVFNLFMPVRQNLATPLEVSE